MISLYSIFWRNGTRRAEDPPETQRYQSASASGGRFGRRYWPQPFTSPYVSTISIKLTLFPRMVLVQEVVLNTAKHTDCEPIGRRCCGDVTPTYHCFVSIRLQIKIPSTRHRNHRHSQFSLVSAVCVGGAGVIHSDGGHHNIFKFKGKYKSSEAKTSNVTHRSHTPCSPGI